MPQPARALWFLAVAALAAGLVLPVAAAGFGEGRDFTLAAASGLLSDLGPGRLDMAGTLGAPELNKTLNRTAPVTLMAHATLFYAIGRDPAAQLAAVFVAHLAVVGATMLLARRWRPERRTALIAGLAVALHPAAVGATAGLSSLGVMLAMLGGLASATLAVSLIREGRWTALVPLPLICALAAGADTIGLLAGPLVVAVALAVPDAPWRTTVWRRALAAAAALAGVSATAFYLTAMGKPIEYLSSLRGWRPALLPAQAAWMLRAMFLPLDPTLTRGPTWLGSVVVALFCSALITGSVFVLRRRPGLAAWPALALATLPLVSATLSLPIKSAPPSSWAAFYPAVVCFALWLAELWPDPSRRGRRAAIAAAVVLCLSPQVIVLSASLMDHARRVQRLGREFAVLLRQIPDGEDVLLTTDSASIPTLESAFLAANYGGAATRQIRYRLLLGGRVVYRDDSAPGGEYRGVFMRLPLDKQKTFIGFSRDRRQLIDLSGLIAAKVQLAQDEIVRERRSPPPLVLVDEKSIDDWLNGCAQWPPLEEGDYAWFVEGAMLRLHPYAGRDFF
jgi:hypothetical protein